MAVKSAKKFVKVSDFSLVFNPVSEVVTPTKVSDWDVTALKSGVTLADEHSILFINDSVFGKWIWAKGTLYSGNDLTDLDITFTGDNLVGATSSRTESGDIDLAVFHEDKTVTTGTTGVSDASKLQVITGVTYDRAGHLVGIQKQEIPVRVDIETDNFLGVTYNSDKTKYKISHPEADESGNVGPTKTVTNNEVTIASPYISTDTRGHVTKIGTTSYKITAADLGLDNGVHMRGVVDPTPVITDGSSTVPNKDGEPLTNLQSGDIIIQAHTEGGHTYHKEFIWNGTAWEEMGDESLYLIGATGDRWIKAYENNNFVMIEHNGPQAGVTTKAAANQVVYSVTTDAKGHLTGVGFTGTKNSTLGVTGSEDSEQARIYITGEDNGIVPIQGVSGIGVEVKTVGGDEKQIFIGNKNTLTPAAVSGTTYKIANAVVAGTTYTLYGKDTQYGITAQGISGVDITMIASTGGTNTKVSIVSADDSITVGVSSNGKVVIDYTGISTPDDWATISNS